MRGNPVSNILEGQPAVPNLDGGSSGLALVPVRQPLYRMVSIPEALRDSVAIGCCLVPGPQLARRISGLASDALRCYDILRGLRRACSYDPGVVKRGRYVRALCVQAPDQLCLDLHRSPSLDFLLGAALA